MKPSSILKGISNLWNKVVKLYDHAETASAVAGVIFSGVDPGDQAPTIAKKFYGLFSKDDERDFIPLLRKLDSGGNGPNQVAVRAFMAWLLPHKTKTQHRISKMYGNHFRTFFLKMSEKDAEKYLGEMARDIIKNGGKVAAFKKLRNKLQQDGVPLPPENAAQTIDGYMEDLERELYRTPKAALIRQTRQVERRVRRKEQKMGWFARLLGKLI